MIRIKQLRKRLVVAGIASVLVLFIISRYGFEDGWSRFLSSSTTTTTTAATTTTSTAAGNADFQIRADDGEGRSAGSSSSSTGSSDRNSAGCSGARGVVRPTVKVKEKRPDMDTTDIYPTLNFNASWIPLKHYWSNMMQARYENRREKSWKAQPLQVILMPHSHNDPGWLQTFESYFASSTRQIISGAVDKLTKYKDLTFIWTEISFLSLWWSKAESYRKENLKKLVSEGRFEILTGGWVMTDEANVDLYAMVDQLVEGHQWVWETFGVRPKSSWSVDPFGHGGTFPYILKKSGIDAMLIMRFHYAWKEYFAINQVGDFSWQQRWDPTEKSSILCKAFPYEIYSVRSTCGPTSDVCDQFSFWALGSKKFFGPYSQKTVPVTPSNIKERSELILDQYGKTGSLTPHNVVLVPIGEDFLYDEPTMWDTMYSNYKAIADYINERREVYNAEIKFGTLTDYFEAVKERQESFSSLSGDFFVYSEVFSDGYPAYWSGYYTSRPLMKRLGRDLEGSLRAAEILFTVAHLTARKQGGVAVVEYFQELYSQNIVTARRNLGLFQHHDAITGTSKQFVVNDYANKLHAAIKGSAAVHKAAMKYLLLEDKENMLNDNSRDFEDAFERVDNFSPPRPVPLDVKSGDGNLVVFNPLASGRRVELLSFYVEDVRVAHDLCITADEENFMEYQVNPTVSMSENVGIDTGFVQVVFLAELEPLSIARFRVFVCSDELSKKGNKSDALASKKPNYSRTKVFCRKCPPAAAESIPTFGSHGKSLKVDELPNRMQMQLENSNLLLSFDIKTKHVSSVSIKSPDDNRKVDAFQVQIGGYPTVPFANGAYLFSPNPAAAKNDPRGPSSKDGEKGQRDYVEVFNEDDIVEVMVFSGKVYSEVTIIYQNSVPENPQDSAQMAFFAHTVRLYHCKGQCALSKGIFVENEVYFGAKENHSNLDMFMRVKSSVENGATFYTDQNGFQMQRRKRSAKLRLEANVYPVTNMAFIEDDRQRLTVVMDHAAAATSKEPGWLEVVMDRRASYDDRRGLGEGLLDTVTTTHKYWLLLEELGGEETAGDSSWTVSSGLAAILSQRLDSPVVQYHVKNGVGDGSTKLNQKAALISGKRGLPCGLHLLNFRTTNDPGPLQQQDKVVPSGSVLMILQSWATTTPIANAGECNNNNGLVVTPECDDYIPEGSDAKTTFGLRGLTVKKATATSLTGLPDDESTETPTAATTTSSGEVTIPFSSMGLETYRLDF